MGCSSDQSTPRSGHTARIYRRSWFFLSTGALSLYSNGFEFLETAKEIYGRNPGTLGAAARFVHDTSPNTESPASFKTTYALVRLFPGERTERSAQKARTCQTEMTFAFALRWSSGSSICALFSESLTHGGPRGNLSSGPVDPSGPDLTVDDIVRVLRAHSANGWEEMPPAAEMFLEHLDAALELASHSERSAAVFHADPGRARYTRYGYDLFRKGVTELLRAPQGWLPDGGAV